jgi:hypothetical protein
MEKVSKQDGLCFQVVSCETGYTMIYLGTGILLTGNKPCTKTKGLDWIGVGTIQKTICTPARQLEYSLSEIVLFFKAIAAYPAVEGALHDAQHVTTSHIVYS